MFLYYSSSKTLACLPATAANILLAKAVKKVSTKSAGERNMLLPQQKMLPSPRATWVNRGKSRWLDEITAWSNLNWPNVQTSDWYFPVNFINLFTWWERVGNWEAVILYSHQIYKTLGYENKNPRWFLFSIYQAYSMQKLSCQHRACSTQQNCC